MVQGTVRDCQNSPNAPATGVTVHIDPGDPVVLYGNSGGSKTDASGFFLAVGVPAGVITVTAEYAGEGDDEE